MPANNTLVDESLLCLESELPDGLVIASSVYGRCLVAAKVFKKGQFVYSTHMNLGKADKYMFRVHSADGVATYENDSVQSVQDVAFEGDAGVRQLCPWDGFMNHSCEPNVLCMDIRRTADRIYYDALALRDIDIGDELSCDYACYDYECDGHPIETCLCGTNACRGSMRGFKHLNWKEKLAILPHTCPSVVKKFIEETRNVRYIDLSLSLPAKVDVMCRDEWELVASHDIKAGELIFCNTSIEITEPSTMFLVHLRGNWKLAVHGTHFLHRDDYMEFLGFDSFMQHSCDPNSIQRYSSRLDYDVHAVKDIVAGEWITCDYNALDNKATGAKLVNVMSFQCSCGSDRCRGKIYC